MGETLIPRLRRGALLSVPGTLIPGVSAYIAFVAIERVDSARTLGYLSLSWVIANIVSAAVALGPAHTALQLMTGAPSESSATRARFRGLVRRQSLVAGIAVAAVGTAVLPASRPFGAVVILSAPWLVGQAHLLFETETLKAAHRFGEASLVLTLRAIIGWGASVAGAAIVGGLAATILPTAIVGLAFAAVLGAGQVDRITELDRTAARAIGRPIGRLSLAGYALGYGDRFVVQAFLGPLAVATYTLGYQLGEGAIELVTDPVAAAALPKIVGTWQTGGEGHEAALALSRRIGACILALAAVTPMLVYAIRPTGAFRIISTDPRFPAVVAITAGAVGLQGITRIGYSLLLAQGRTHTALMNFALAVILSAIAAPLFCWQWGIVGAAWATLLGYGSLAVATLVSIRSNPNP